MHSHVAQPLAPHLIYTLSGGCGPSPLMRASSVPPHHRLPVTPLSRRRTSAASSLDLSACLLIRVRWSVACHLSEKVTSTLTLAMASGSKPLELRRKSPLDPASEVLLLEVRSDFTQYIYMCGRVRHLSLVHISEALAHCCSQARPANYMLNLRLQGPHLWVPLTLAPGLVPQQMLWGVSPPLPPPLEPSHPSSPPLPLLALPSAMFRPPPPLLPIRRPSSLFSPASAGSGHCGSTLLLGRRHPQRAHPAQGSSSKHGAAVNADIPLPTLSLSLVTWRSRQRTALCATLPMAHRPLAAPNVVRCGT